jgi:hypothetical protein
MNTEYKNVIVIMAHTSSYDRIKFSGLCQVICTDLVCPKRDLKYYHFFAISSIVSLIFIMNCCGEK